MADNWFESLTILAAESDLECALSIDEITNSFAVFTALASTSYVGLDQSYAYTFYVAGIP